MKQASRFCNLLAVLLIIVPVRTFAQQGWVKQESGSGTWLSDVFFVNGTTGMVVGESGLILRTTNGGATWTTSNAGVYETLLDIFMVNRDTAIAVGAGGLILRTTNGGNTWQQTRVDPYRWLYSVWFPRPALGIVVGESGAMFRSTDGGASWSYVTDPPMSYLSGVTLTGVAFADSLSGMVVGSMGTILRTTDGGGTWYSVNLTTSQSLMDVAIPDPDYATVVGEGGAWLSPRATTQPCNRSGGRRIAVSPYVVSGRTWEGLYARLCWTSSSMSVNRRGGKITM